MLVFLKIIIIEEYYYYLVSLLIYWFTFLRRFLDISNFIPTFRVVPFILNYSCWQRRIF